MEEISKEVTEMKFMLEKIEGIIDARLVGIEDAEEDEIREIEDYAKRKREGKIELNEL
jgi:low affinity Fe/Cu permease